MNFSSLKNHITQKKKFVLSPLTMATNIHNSYKHNNPFSQTSLNSSIIKIQTQKHNLKINQIMTIKAKRKKRHKPSNPSGLRWGGRRAAVEWKAQLGTVNADSSPTCVLRSTVEQARSLACSFSLYLFLCFLSQRELENVLNQVEKENVEKQRAGECVLESSRKRK